MLVKHNVFRKNHSVRKQMTITPTITGIPSLFSSTNFSIGQTAGNSINFQTGIPSIYSLDITSGGSYITRIIMNGIVRLISASQYFHQCGYITTFDSSVSSAIGGYPLGAILDYFDTSYNVVRKVRSLIENNTYDFTSNTGYIDGAKWAYVDKINLPSGIFDI